MAQQKDKYRRMVFTTALMEGDYEHALNCTAGAMHSATHAGSRSEHRGHMGDLIAMFREARAHLGEAPDKAGLHRLAHDMDAVRNTRAAWRLTRGSPRRAAQKKFAGDSYAL